METLNLMQFIDTFGAGLLDAVSRQNPPVHDGTSDPCRAAVMQALARKPFDQQQEAVQAVTRLLLDAGERAAVLNAEMGTGKTMMSIAAAAVFHAEGARRFLVLSPPHLVYKWRREILLTMPNARVTVLNGPDTLRKLLQVRDEPWREAPGVAQFYILGRVRMRLGFHWRPAAKCRLLRVEDEAGVRSTFPAAACPRCYRSIESMDGTPVRYDTFMADDNRRHVCKDCGEQLWTLHRPAAQQSLDYEGMVHKALCSLPTIGPKRADGLLARFGAQRLAGKLVDNVYEFVNLMDGDGEFVFSERQSQRIERGLARAEFSWGQGCYQASEFIKRYLPQGFFDLAIVDEGHEYKNEGSAQGQAMGVLVSKCPKVLLLTGTLMGGYASDLFYLLFRLMPEKMIEDGFAYNGRGSLGTAAFNFARQHGVQKDIIRTRDDGPSTSHRTSRGKRTSTKTVEAPGFGPAGVCRFVLPFTVFLKLADLGAGILPGYEERYHELELDPEIDMDARYRQLERELQDALAAALRVGDNSLLGVVLNALLAWPDCCFREETVRHPHTRQVLSSIPAVLGEEPSPKESALIRLVQDARARGRRTLVYTIYTGGRDTTTRVRELLQARGLKVAVLKSTVDTGAREEWIADAVDRGCDVLLTNPELVKTGLDLLDFPEIVYLQTGYSVYTLQQASRRSWRIGQREDVTVHFLGYAGTAQMACLALMAKKIAVSQSTSGDVPDTGLDALNQDGDSIEVALAREILARAA